MPSPIKTPTPRVEELDQKLGLSNAMPPLEECYDQMFSLARQLETELAEAKAGCETVSLYHANAARLLGIAFLGMDHPTINHAIQKEVLALRSSLAASQERVRELERGLEQMHMLAASEGWNTPLFKPEFGKAVRVARALLKS